jgi:hypothetical protein
MRSSLGMKQLLSWTLVALSVAPGVRTAAQQFYPIDPTALDALLARARALELDAGYVPPPGGSQSCDRANAHVVRDLTKQVCACT